MEACIPFLSTALPTDLEASGAKTECAARLQRPFTLRSPLQTDRVQESKLHLLLSYPVGPCCRLASLWAAPGHHTLAYPHSGLATVCWMLTKRGRRWQLADLLDSYPSALGHKDVLVWWGWFKRQERELVKDTEWTDRERYHWGHKANTEERPLPLFLCPSLPFHNMDPAPAPPKVGSVKACFLPFSTMGPFSASCFCSDRGALPPSCADRPAKSCCGLLVQRGHIYTGSKNTLTNRHQIVRNVQILL